MSNIFEIADKLIKTRSLTLEEYRQLVAGFDPQIAEYLKAEAVKKRKSVYGNRVFVRGLIEISNICKNNCYYCGIRAENKNCHRYRLNSEEIIGSCVKGYELGLRSFVLQSGEGSYNYEAICALIKAIKEKCPGCAITLSLGEYTRESYQGFFDAGADRYLLRHEAADIGLYERLHPQSMSLKNRMECLEALKDIGYQTGCGFMVGAPYQTPEHIARDLKFIEEFKPQMCGIGPFVPHKDTIFKEEKAGSAELTCYLLSIIRLIHPDILLPATTALGTVAENGLENGMLSGANVVMPNITPVLAREKYEIYDNKSLMSADSAEQLKALENRMNAIGYQLDMSRGDHNKRW